MNIWDEIIELLQLSNLNLSSETVIRSAYR